MLVNLFEWWGWKFVVHHCGGVSIQNDKMDNIGLCAVDALVLITLRDSQVDDGNSGEGESAMVKWVAELKSGRVWNNEPGSWKATDAQRIKPIDKISLWRSRDKKMATALVV